MVTRCSRVTDHQDSLWWRRAYRIQARYLETAGNIASGHAMYGLANDCWALAHTLRLRAKGETVEREPD